MRYVAAWSAEEDNHEHADHVESGQERREQRHGENRRVAFVGERKNCVFAEEAAKRRTADQRQRTDNEGNKCDREFPGKASLLQSVLLVLKLPNDWAGVEEQTR